MQLGLTVNKIPHRALPYYYMVVILGVSALLYRFAFLLNSICLVQIDKTMYLTWHIIIEFSSTLISFAVFLVLYYSFDQTRNVKNMLVGSAFLASGLIDAFHALSYHGMPDFFIVNDSAGRATLLWVIARLTASMGFVVSSFLPFGRVKHVHRRWFCVVPVVYSIVILYLATYYPALFPPMILDGYGMTPIKIALEYVVILLYGISALKLLWDFRQTGSHSALWFSTALFVMLIGEFAFTAYKQVFDIYNFMGHVYKLFSYWIIFRAMFVYNVQKPYSQLYQAKHELRKYARNLDKLVETRTQELKSINQKLVDDLEYARDVQKALLPVKMPYDQGVSFDAAYYPAERVSGDFYNILRLDEQNIGIYIGDVAGHGVAAAMLTVFVNQSIRGIHRLDTDAISVASPALVLQELYTAYNNTNFKDEVYVVMFYARYNTRTQMLTFASAGLNVFPVLLREDGTMVELQVPGFPICKFIEYMPGVYEERQIQLQKGDRVVLYTDGLIEARNRKGDYFGVERLRKVLAAYSNKSAAEINQAVTCALHDFLGEHPVNDDITFFVMDISE